MERLFFVNRYMKKGGEKGMKRLILFVAIAVTIGMGLGGSVWAGHLGEVVTNTVTKDSDTLGLSPTDADISKFTQDANLDGDNNVLTGSYQPAGDPGAFTNNPFNIVCDSADYGNGHICGGNTFTGGDPITAPDFSGTNTARGTIVVKVPANLDTTDASGRLTLTGIIDFCLNIDQKCDPNNANDTAGMATVTQTMTQRLEGLDVNDPQGRTAFQEITIDNRGPGGSPISFATEASATTTATSPARNIPWSISLTQDIPFPGDNFVLNVAGTYEYAGIYGDGTNRPNDSGFTGSQWPASGTFDLPGFGGTTDFNGTVTLP